MENPDLEPGAVNSRSTAEKCQIVGIESENLTSHSNHKGGSNRKCFVDIRKNKNGVHLCLQKGVLVKWWMVREGGSSDYRDLHTTRIQETAFVGGNHAAAQGVLSISDH